MLIAFVAVASGGAAGSVLRYGLGRLAARLGKPAHAATLFINCIGSLLLGLLAGAAVHERHMLAYALAGIGFLGGFTTFSTLNVQLVAMLEQRKFGEAGLYFILTYGVGIPLAAAGYWLAQFLYIHYS